MNGFLVECLGSVYDEQNGMKLSGAGTKQLGCGVYKEFQIFCDGSGSMSADILQVHYDDCDVKEQWVNLRNTGKTGLEITRIDSLKKILPADRYTLMYYTSSWGKEFELVSVPLEGTKILEVKSGRSSNGMHPWFALVGSSGSILTCAIAWSGNWIARFEPLAGGRYHLTAGLNNWQFHKTLEPGESLESPHIISCDLAKGDLADTSLRLGKWGRRHWYPKNPLSQSIPVEWNSWWPYEDVELNEDVFKANVDVCGMIGVEVCTLDAGWFGPSDDSSKWYRLRGDWNHVNGMRFPSGIRSLSDYVHGKGLKFGIWCEIEACCADAELTSLRPDLIARRDGAHLGCVCMGNPETVEWAFGVLERLIVEYGADWIKLDFNLDPGAGCNRTDHGHGEGDGLYAHYMGYYRLLDRIREKYPHVVLENCASGGLRIDLGILKHLHMTFLSDPDYSEHCLQLVQGASTMLHPSACLHWAWSQTRDTFTATPANDPICVDMPLSKFDYMIRNAMLTVPGFSYRLPDFPQWCIKRLAYHIAFYKNTVRRFVLKADMISLAGQVLRSGEGERWSCFLYVDEAGGGLLFVFRLKGGETAHTVMLHGLAEGNAYQLEFQDSGISLKRTGAELLTDGLTFDSLVEESSEIVRISLMK
jgi:alpha-galactosidase